jgi:hypothetical protein
MMNSNLFTRCAQRSAGLAAGLAAAAALCACGSAPLSYLDGNLRPSSRLEFHVYPVRVISIDGDFSRQNPRNIAPGMHTLVVVAAPGRGARDVGQQAFPFKVEACTRYYIAAKREGAMSANWSLFVQETEPVAGCDPAQEWEKAKASPSGNSPAPASQISAR